MSGVLTIEEFAGDIAAQLPELAGFEQATAAERLTLLTRRGLTSLCAKNDAEACRWLGIGRTKLWALTNLPKSDPRRICRTSYGKIALSELRRHLEADLKRERGA